VDDGSTDDSLSVIERFAQSHPIVRVLRNETRMGVVFTANRGLEAAHGDYICFASANDVVLPGFFEKLMGLLATHPGAGLGFSDPVIFYDSGPVIAERLGWADHPGYLTPDDLVCVMRRDWKRSLGGTSSILKRSALVEAGGLRPELRWQCDWFALLVMAFRYGLCYVPEGLAAWRAGRGSYASNYRRWPAQREVIFQVLSLLKSPAYRDVLPFFKRSGVLSFPPFMLRALAVAPEHWDCLSWLLIRRVAPYSVRHFLSGVTPVSVKRIYHSVRHKRIGRISPDTGSFKPRVSS
jgi:glycosyltransferase involved in cell wall biosynthesis